METELGVVVGRFQTHYLTKGHQHLLDQVHKEHKKVLILIGVTPCQPTERNPMDYVTRWAMVKKAYPHAIIAPIPDCSSDAAWSANVDKVIQDTLKALSSNEGAILYGCRDCFIKTYSGTYPTKELESASSVSSTELRAKCANEPAHTSDFRKGIIYAISNRLASPYICVDVAMTDSSGEKLLVGKKKHDKEFRFIGGFVDSTDESITAAAARELLEETGATADSYTLIGEAKIDDWRYRRDEEKVFTTLHFCIYRSGEIKASDDIVEVQWLPVAKLEQYEFIQEHWPLKKMFLKHYQTYQYNR